MLKLDDFETAFKPPSYPNRFNFIYVSLDHTLYMYI